METGQVSTAAAEVYERLFVPALFAQWVEPMLDAAGAGVGDRVLDVGTGTGILARSALRRVGSTGSVVAVDPNRGMLSVAARMAPGLDLRCGVAESLPVDDGEIDCLTAQFVLMFVADRQAAIEEMMRVLRPGGRVAVATWAALDESPGYAAMADLFADVLGDWAVTALRAPFCIGTADELADLMRTSFPDVSVVRQEGQARFPSLDDWLCTEIRGWTLAERVDDEQFAALRRVAATRLGRFAAADGAISFGAPALLAAATAS
jgi:ubiquinone/menaquinone biosynthesis C-methylase UbiE